MESLLSLSGPQPQSKFTSSRCPATSRGSRGGTNFNVSFQLRDNDTLRTSNHRNFESASYLERPLPSLLENYISLPLQLGSAVTAVLLGFSSASANAATGEATLGVPEDIVSATTEALTDSIPAPLSAENSDAANVVISVLLTSAFIGLVVLTLGVRFFSCIVRVTIIQRGVRHYPLECHEKWLLKIMLLSRNILSCGEY